MGKHSKIKTAAAFFLVCGFLFLVQQSSSNQADPQEELRPPFDWPVSTAEAQGLNSVIFQLAHKEAEKIPNLASLLVVRNGYLIFEGYYHLKNSHDALNVYSVSKSFTSALVGIAIKEGFLTGIDQKVMDFFPEYAHLINDQRKFDITLRHLISMKAGWDFQEELSDYITYFNAQDRIRHLLELPLLADPGTDYDYDSGQTDLLSAIISRASGMSTKEFAERYLFTPLNISIRDWDQIQPGLYAGGYGMYYTPRDMARFGWLYLKKGNLAGLQIVPEEWVEETIEKDTQFVSDYGPLTNRAYGYGWWLASLVGYEVIHASGHYGQRIFIFPEIEMVVVTTVEPSGIWASPYTIDAMNLVMNTIVGPVKDHLGNPPYLPLAPSVQRKQYRSLFQRSFVDILGWQPNHRNAGADIIGYRIYLIHDSHIMQLIGEVNAATLFFYNPNVYEKQLCTYGITSVTGEGIESLPATVTVRHPTR